MQKDIRDIVKNNKEENVKLSDSHAIKFKALLEDELQVKKPKKNTFKWLSVAASIVLLISLGIQFYPTQNIKNNDEVNPVKEITLGTISPEFKTIETYYTNSINLEISQLELNDNNKDIIDGYLLKIKELTKEYKSLTKELNTKGVNDSTIDALMRNLQLRLQLLKRLKEQLKQLKNLNSKQDDTQII